MEKVTLKVSKTTKNTVRFQGTVTGKFDITIYVQKSAMQGEELTEITVTVDI